ncbi:MAG TPA: hypothetical protein VGH91_02720 [Gammaproteobacteria bacterium]|jgi:hypothetical protein
MKKFLSIILGATMVMLSACGGETTTPDNQATTLAFSQKSAIKDQAAKDIHDQDAFKKLWDDMYAGMTEPPLPTVDFTKNTVVAYYLGEMKHGGFVIRVTRAEAVKDGYDVDFLVIAPGANCHNETQDTTHAFLMATVPTTQQVTFDVQNRKEAQCG